MSKTSKIILVTIIATCILLGLGYAAIQNITLNVIGTVAADPNQANFKVGFVGTPEVSDGTYVSAGITNSTNATINVSGLTTKGQKVTATYNIKNDSKDLSSDLSVKATSSNTEYFVVSSRLNKSSLVAGEETTVTVTVELSKTLIENSASTNIGITLDAYPVEPGKEGTSGNTNDFSQTLHGINEYGFFFNTVYSDTRGEDKVSIIFYEDTSANMYVNNMLVGCDEPGFWKYSENSILSGEVDAAERMEFVPSEDGTNIKSWMFDMNVDLEFTEKLERLNGRQNEYGFYFGEGYTYYFYSIDDESNSVTFVPYADGSVDHYVNDVLVESYPANTLIYGDTIDTTILDIGNLSVLDNGRVLKSDRDEYAGLDPYFWERTTGGDPNVLNKYGFYYNRSYTGLVDENITYKFHENRGGELYINGILYYYLEPGSWIYEDSKIMTNQENTADRIVLNVINNGDALTSSGYTCYLDDEFDTRINELKEKRNEYGFCYGEAYSLFEFGPTVEDGNSTCSMVLYEDGSVDYYVNDKLAEKLPANTLKYSRNKIDATELNIGELLVQEDGTILLTDDAWIGLDPYFWERATLPEGQYYGRKDLISGEIKYYRTLLLNEDELSDVFLAGGYRYKYDGDWHGWSATLVTESDNVPNDYVYYDKNQTEYGEILENINGKPVVSVNDLFNYCVNMKKAPVIPSTVRYMSRTFAFCNSLEGDIVINTTNVEDYYGCFESVDMTNIRLVGNASVSLRNAIGSTGIKYNSIQE